MGRCFFFYFISYTMVSPPVLGDNPRGLARGLSPVQNGHYFMVIFYYLHQCRPFTLQCTRSSVLM